MLTTDDTPIKIRTFLPHDFLTSFHFQVLSSVFVYKLLRDAEKEKSK